MINNSPSSRVASAFPRKDAWKHELPDDEDCSVDAVLARARARVNARRRSKGYLESNTTNESPSAEGRRASLSTLDKLVREDSLTDLIIGFRRQAAQDSEEHKESSQTTVESTTKTSKKSKKKKGRKSKSKETGEKNKLESKSAHSGKTSKSKRKKKKKKKNGSKPRGTSFLNEQPNLEDSFASLSDVQYDWESEGDQESSTGSTDEDLNASSSSNVDTIQYLTQLVEQLQNSLRASDREKLSMIQSKEDSEPTLSEFFEQSESLHRRSQEPPIDSPIGSPEVGQEKVLLSPRDTPKDRISAFESPRGVAEETELSVEQEPLLKKTDARSAAMSDLTLSPPTPQSRKIYSNGAPFHLPFSEELPSRAGAKRGSRKGKRNSQGQRREVTPYPGNTFAGGDFCDDYVLRHSSHHRSTMPL